MSIDYIKRDLKSIHQNLTVVNHKIYKEFYLNVRDCLTINRLVLLILLEYF